MNELLVVISIIPIVFIVYVGMYFTCSKNRDANDTEDIESLNEPLVSVEPIVVDNSVIYSQTTSEVSLLFPTELQSSGPIIVQDSQLPVNMKFSPENFPSVNAIVCSLDSNGN